MGEGDRAYALSPNGSNLLLFNVLYSRSAYSLQVNLGVSRERICSTGYAADPGIAQPISTSVFKPWGRFTTRTVQARGMGNRPSRTVDNGGGTGEWSSIPDHRSVLMRGGSPTHSSNRVFNNRVFKFCVYPLSPSVAWLKRNPAQGGSERR
jgi:hypothetical protein